MKKFLLLFIIAILLIPGAVFAKSDTTLYLFYSNTCSHCHAEIEYLKSIEDKYDINIEYLEKDSNNTLLTSVRKKLKIDNSYVPLTIVGTDYFIGFNDDSKNKINALIKSYQKNDHCNLVDLVKNNKSTKDCFSKNDGIYSESEVKSIPLIGDVNVKNTSLTLISMIIGLVDGFNPCAMWVLIFIISMLIDMKDRKKLLILGLIFIISSSIIYLFFMLAWLKITNGLISSWFRYVISLVAIVAGFINIKNYIKTKNTPTGCTVTNKEDRRKIVVRAKNAINQNKFILAIIGIIALAFSVNLVELACSAGLPTFFITILEMNDLNSLQYAFYMFIYILFFLIDDIIVFLLAVFTFKITAISNKYTKYSHLIGGLIMIIIAILLTFFPNIIMFNF